MDPRDLTVLIQNELAGSDLGKRRIHEDLFSSILLRNKHCRRENCCHSGILLYFQNNEPAGKRLIFFFLLSKTVVGGTGFIAKGLTFANTAGSYGNQAVAVRGSADKIAFYQCNLDSWQDTLYAHTFRHFYRDCMILGTVDFIFGNSQAVFQNCQIVAKKTTLVGQQNTYTAQGKTDIHQTTGLSFQACSFEGTAALLQAQTTPEASNVYKTYLGRPWKPYSTAVLLRNTLGGHIDPAGWLNWNQSSYGLYTSYFAEYQSSGAGAPTNQRVSWSHQITKATDADKWQAGHFIQVGSWLDPSTVPFDTSNF